jgi:hypothetical protein
MLNLNAFLVIFLAIASFMIGSSSNDLTEQVVIAQNKTEDNNTDEDNMMNGSGTISNLQTPIRPPFA